MLTQTPERQELQQIIDTLSDDRVMAALDFFKGGQPYTETDDGYLPHVPNEKTASAIREGQTGNVKRFNSIDALLADLRNDNDD